MNYRISKLQTRWVIKSYYINFHSMQTIEQYGVKSYLKEKYLSQKIGILWRTYLVSPENRAIAHKWRHLSTITMIQLIRNLHSIFNGTITIKYNNKICSSSLLLDSFNLRHKKRSNKVNTIMIKFLILKFWYFSVSRVPVLYIHVYVHIYNYIMYTPVYT